MWDDDPQFVDSDNGDFRLLPTSPCIDAGSNAAVPADTLDLDGDGTAIAHRRTDNGIDSGIRIADIHSGRADSELGILGHAGDDCAGLLINERRVHSRPLAVVDSDGEVAIVHHHLPVRQVICRQVEHLVEGAGFQGRFGLRSLCRIVLFGTEIENMIAETKMYNLKIMEDKAMLPTITRRTFSPFLSNLFDDDFFPVLTGRNSSMPAVNIRENEKNFTLELAVPGIDKKDLKIDINEDVLTISHESKSESEENQDGYKRKEFSYSSFCRSFYVPENVNLEKIGANYKDGVLIVELPKNEEEKNKITRQVKIS